MSAMSDYLENKLIDHVLRGVAFTAPSTVYVGLFTAAPSDSGGGTEVSGGNYARASIACSTANFSATNGAGTTTNPSSGTGGRSSNNNVVTFNVPSANWGTITHFGLFDASTSGNLLFHGALTASKTVNNGDPAPTIQADKLGITLA